MKNNRKSSRSVLALLLVFCLLASIVPGAYPVVAAAESRISGTPIPVGTVDELKTAVNQLNEGGGGTIVLQRGVYELYEPLTVTSIITLQATDTCLIQCAGPNWTTGAVSPTSSLHNSLIDVYGEYGRLTVEGNITVNPDSKCRAINLENRATLHLFGCIIRNGMVSGIEAGGGVCVGGGCYLYAGEGTQFVNNSGTTGTATSGGAVYVGFNGTAELEDVTFNGNSAHSGGAIYTFHGLVTCNDKTQFIGNSASQRGGAIHDHGLVVLNGTTISGQTSGQFGGAVYVSANKASEDTYDLGRLILVDATITGNTCGNSGGGIYITDMKTGGRFFCLDTFLNM